MTDPMLRVPMHVSSAENFTIIITIINKLQTLDKKSFLQLMPPSTTLSNNEPTLQLTVLVNKLCATVASKHDIIQQWTAPSSWLLLNKLWPPSMILSNIEPTLLQLTEFVSKLWGPQEQLINWLLATPKVFPLLGISPRYTCTEKAGVNTGSCCMSK